MYNFVQKHPYFVSGFKDDFIKKNAKNYKYIISINVKLPSDNAYFILEDMELIKKKKIYRIYSEFKHFWAFETSLTKYNKSKMIKWMGLFLQKFDDD